MSTDITIIERLQGDDWKEWPDSFRKYGRSFFKRFATPTRCNLNSDKQGMQIQIVVSSWEGKENHEVFLNGELPDGTWIELHQHGLSDDIEKTLSMVIPRLLAVWESAATYPSNQ